MRFVIRLYHLGLGHIDNLLINMNADMDFIYSSIYQFNFSSLS